MSARDVLDAARAAGVELTPEGDRLRWCGPASAELLAQLRWHKAELLALLGAGRPPYWHDLTVVVQDLLEAGTSRGRVRRMFGLSWPELDELLLRCASAAAPSPEAAIRQPASSAREMTNQKARR